MYEQRILRFCCECRTRTQVVRRTRNYPRGERTKMLVKLKQLNYLESFFHENKNNKTLRRPVQYWNTSNIGKKYLLEIDKWVAQRAKEGAL